MLHTPQPLRLAVAALIAATAVGLAGCSNGNDMSGMPGMDHASSSTPSTTASPAAGPHNMDDVMFAQMMIPHHQQAIEMSDIILAKGRIDPKVSELASQIKAAQAPEIARMSGWLAGWGQNPSPSTAMDHGDGGGMMSQADMDALESADDTEAARLFLTGMIAHHQGAISMAEDELTSGQNPEAKQLAQEIIDTQQAEITTMNHLLEQL